ncbi:hypothetical protein HYW99_01455 [Candidatus Woesearchaeota archaeon]|nr:hypothetical protein [Candidatus Woesearchaeota archaeon]
MIYGSIDKLKMEYAAELVATLSYAILHAGDSIGFAFFNDKIIKSEPPSIGFKQYYKFMKCLVDPNQYGGNCDLSQALKFLISYLKEYSIVIIVSDFIGLKENWQSYVRIISKKYDLIGIMIRDPRDENLPEYNGQVVFSDIFSARQLIVNVNLVRENYAKYVALQEQEIEKAFIDSKSDFIKLTTDRPFIKPISDLFLRRANRHR